MKIKFLLPLSLFAFLFILSSPSYSCPNHSKTLVPIDQQNPNQMSKERFYEILDWFYSHYAPVVEKEGGKLLILPDWEEPLTSAFAQRDKDNWIIRVMGGLARHRAMTEDGFILVLCHEIGHHIGGFPKKTFWGRPDWTSTEGQADYYASLKCFRKLFKDQDHSHIDLTQVPKIVIQKCGESFPDHREKLLCIRSSMANLSHARLLNWPNEQTQKVSFETPDPKRVRRTLQRHPSPQCRLDTGFAGALCPISEDIKVSQKDEVVGTCHQKLNFKIGLRPSCWFKEQE